MTHRIGLAVGASGTLIALLLGTPTPAAAAGVTFTVNRTGDAPDINPGNAKCDASSNSGLQCTLRAAIQEANAHAGADVIKFAITSSSKVIKPGSPLPPITHKLTINGYSQSGASANTLAVGDNAVLKIVLDGTNAGGSQSALLVQADGVIIKGLVIQNFQNSAIRIGADNVTISGNFIGTDRTGLTAAGNSGGIFVVDSGGLIVGGSTPAARNIISGNSGGGVDLIRATGAFIQGNYIGTDKNGTSALGNSAAGVAVADGGAVTIGGLTTSARNVISANGGPGIDLSGSSNHNTVQANVVGGGASGSVDLGNGNNGITLIDSGFDTIGGAGQAGNAILHNFNGITIDSTSNSISGNAVESNDFVGVFISGGSLNTIGGNAVIGNASTGVLVTAGLGNRITGNTMAANHGLAIDLLAGTQDSFGVTANDPKDPDSGPNGLQNFPVLTSAIRAANGVTTVAGTLNTVPVIACRVEFFVAVADPSGHGEGFTPIGSTTFTTNSSGNRTFSFATAQLAPGQLVTATATATGTGNTSEFSANVPVVQQ